MVDFRSANSAYDRPTLWFHWMTVLLVAVQWLGAHTIDWFPKGPLRVDARSLHIVIGASLAVIIVGRLVWRRTKGANLPASDKGLLRLAAGLVHGLLYALVFGTLALGFANAWFRGDSLFGLIRISKPAFVTPALKTTIEDVHGLCANAILGVAALHASAALWHQYWRRDGLLGRMIPGLTDRAPRAS